MSAYLLSSPGFNLTNVTSSVVTQSPLFSVRSLILRCLVVGLSLITSWLGVTGVRDIWYNRLTKLLWRGGRAEVEWCHWFISVVTAGRPQVFLSYPSRGCQEKLTILRDVTKKSSEILRQSSHVYCAKPARRPAMCFVLNMDFTIFWSCVLMKYLKIQIPKLVVFIFALERARLLHTCNQPSPYWLPLPPPPQAEGSWAEH